MAYKQATYKELSQYMAKNNRFSIPFKAVKPDRLDWMLFVLIWTLGGYFIVQSYVPSIGFKAAMYHYLIIILVNTPIILINVFVLVPSFFKLRWILIYFLLFVGLIALSFPLDFNLVNWFVPELYECCKSNQKLFRYVMGTAQEDALFSSFFFAKQYLQFKNRADRAEKEKVKAELDFLKSQINPHFYFNTLNNLYGLALLKSDKAPNAILKLSEIMEYVIYDARSEKVALDREIEYLRNYIELERLRLEGDAKVHFEVNGSTEGLQIAPLLLLPLIENAFKHGANSTQDAVDIKMVININPSNSDVELMVKNKFEAVEKTPGLGIENLKKRLDLIYPNQYKLKHESLDNFYIATLNVGL